MLHWSREVVLLAICHNPVNPQYPPRLGVRITCFLYFLSSYSNVLECVKNCFKKIKPYCSLTLKMFCLIRKYVNLRMRGNYLKSVTSYIKSLNPPFSLSLRCIDLITAFKVAPFDKMSRYFWPTKRDTWNHLTNNLTNNCVCEIIWPIIVLSTERCIHYWTHKILAIRYDFLFVPKDQDQMLPEAFWDSLC